MTEKEFIPYEQALELKELGFDEPCLCSWNFYTNELNFNGQPSTFSSEDVIQLPTFSQAFRWFREKYDFKSWVEEHTSDTFIYEIRPHILTHYKEGEVYVYTIYEETELACLNKLIEITKIK